MTDKPTIISDKDNNYIISRGKNGGIDINVNGAQNVNVKGNGKGQPSTTVSPASEASPTANTEKSKPVMPERATRAFS